MVANLPEGNPLHVLSVEQVREIFVDQVIGTRLNILAIFASPHDVGSRSVSEEEEEEKTLVLVQELVRQVSLEQRVNYDDVRIGLIKHRVAAFKEEYKSRRDVTLEEIHQHFFVQQQ